MIKILFYVEMEGGNIVSENIDKLLKMKEEAVKNNDVIRFNAINLYQRSGNDVTVLIKMIKELYEKSKR